MLGLVRLAPGRYFRLLLIGYFEGLDSERAIAWRAADSFALRQFLDLALVEVAAAGRSAEERCVRTDTKFNIAQSGDNIVGRTSPERPAGSVRVS